MTGVVVHMHEARYSDRSKSERSFVTLNVPAVCFAHNCASSTCQQRGMTVIVLTETKAATHCWRKPSTVAWLCFPGTFFTVGVDCAVCVQVVSSCGMMVSMLTEAEATQEGDLLLAGAIIRALPMFVPYFKEHPQATPQIISRVLSRYKTITWGARDDAARRLLVLNARRRISTSMVKIAQVRAPHFLVPQRQRCMTLYSDRGPRPRTTRTKVQTSNHNNQGARHGTTTTSTRSGRHHHRSTVHTICGCTDC